MKLVKYLSIFCLLSVVNLNILFANKYEEVDKGKIPAQFLDENLKELPSGVKIWDIEESFAALKDKNMKILWIDTRPAIFYKSGTIKNSVLLKYHKNETSLEAYKGEKKVLNKASLDKAVGAIDANKDNVTIVFFCQGPKCHRSYNAALRSVSTWGYKKENVIWMRSGYPSLLMFLRTQPKLKRKLNKFLMGDIITGL